MDGGRSGPPRPPANPYGVAGQITFGEPGNISSVLPAPPPPATPTSPVVGESAAFVSPPGPRMGTDSAVSFDFVAVNRYLWLQPGAATNIATPTSVPPTDAFVSGTPPPNPNVGDFWFNSNDTQLYVWYDDGNSR